MAETLAAHDDNHLVSINPANGDIIASVTTTRPSEIDAVVDGAWTAFRRSGAVELAYHDRGAEGCPTLAAAMPLS